MLHSERRGINNALVRVGVQFLPIATAGAVILAEPNCVRHTAVRNNR